MVFNNNLSTADLGIWGAWVVAWNAGGILSRSCTGMELATRPNHTPAEQSSMCLHLSNYDASHNATFGVLLAAYTGGKFQTGFDFMQNSIAPGREAIFIHGGSSVALDYKGRKMDGYMTMGIDMSGATIAGAAISIPEASMFAMNNKNAMYSDGVNLVMAGGFTTLYASADIYATGSISAAGGCCADYVFESKYNLMKLNDLQIFTKNNHCLPNMTINDTDKVDLVISVNELLVKTEEQALYVLQLHKRLKTLELKKD